MQTINFRVICSALLTSSALLVSVAAHAGSDYVDFLHALAERESSLKTNNVNLKTHYIGLFQMGEMSLKDVGVYGNDSTKTNDWTGSWSGKFGATSTSAFLNSADAQIQAVTAYHQKVWNSYLAPNGASGYLGKTVNGILVTESGLIAAAHLVGYGEVLNWLRSDGQKTSSDASGTTITEYLTKFAGYDMGSFQRPTVAEFYAASPTAGGSTIGTGVGAGTGTAAHNSDYAPISPYASTGDGFAAGAGTNMSVVRSVITGIIASLALLWAAYTTLSCWTGYAAGKLSFFYLKSNVLRGLLILIVILVIVT